MGIKNFYTQQNNPGLSDEKGHGKKRLLTSGVVDNLDDKDPVNSVVLRTPAFWGTCISLV